MAKIDVCDICIQETRLTIAKLYINGRAYCDACFNKSRSGFLS